MSQLSNKEQPESIIKEYNHQNPLCTASGEHDEHDGTTTRIEVDANPTAGESNSSKIDRMLSRALNIANTPYSGDHFEDEKHREGHGPAHCVRQYLLMDKMIEILPANSKDQLGLSSDKEDLIKMAAFYPTHQKQLENKGKELIKGMAGNVK